MKGITSIFISIAAAALLAGCGNKSVSTPQATNSASTNSVSTATNGFGGYVKSLGEAQKSANKTIDVSYINQAIQLFNVQEGRYPQNSSGTGAELCRQNSRRAARLQNRL